MTRSGIYENFTGYHPSVCVGQTIFGLTSTTGQSDIYDINFVADIDQYPNTLGITQTIIPSDTRRHDTYAPNGIRTNGKHGIVVTRGRKYIARRR